MAFLSPSFYDGPLTFNIPNLMGLLKAYTVVSDEENICHACKTTV